MATSTMQNVVIGLLIFSAVLVALISVTLDMTSQYGVEQDVQFNETLTIVRDADLLVTNQSSFIDTTEIDENSFTSMGKEGFKILKLTFTTTPKLLKTIFVDLFTLLTLPEWVAGLFLSIIVAILIFVIIQAFFKT